MKQDLEIKHYHHINNAVMTKDSFILPWNFYTHWTKQEGHQGSGFRRHQFFLKNRRNQIRQLEYKFSDSWNANSAIGGMFYFGYNC